MTVENEIKITTQKVGNTFYEVQDNNIRVVIRVPVTTDSMIKIPLENFNKYLEGSLLIDIDRDKSDSSSTTKGTQRPDFLCWIKKLLIFKGEEKANVSDFDIARIELVEKFNVLNSIFFGNVKFLICYAAAGSNMQFYVINSSKETVKNLNQLMPLTSVLNSINLVDRITILRTTVNIARIMLTISDNIPDVIISLGKKQKLGHSYITFFANSVVKLIPEIDLPYAQNLQSHVRFLTLMYNHVKGHPRLVQIKEDPLFIKDERMYKVKIATRGILCNLNNENDVQKMTKCVLTRLLARLHAGKFIYHDIQILNIMFVPEYHDNFRYVLIDFEHRGMNK
ncbi:hypothetical protein C1646_678054 [Rhizophagus diaphanus]|nr:hypothetical protein C1646_678054 [Rhizophagus diaphanus] [Rhizophagus sp. MUCL 43196]